LTHLLIIDLATPMTLGLIRGFLEGLIVTYIEG
jgi:hypothetical protein